MSFCPKCRENFEAVTGYCPYDGAPLESPSAGGADADGIRPVSAVDAPHELLQQPKFDYDRLLGVTLDGRYLIEQKLGEGGMGVVFRGRHILIEKRVAIKVLKREVARSQVVVTRFVQEAQSASRIGHPNIVDVTDFGITPHGLTYQVMEYIDGVTLSRVIRKAPEPMTVERAVPIIGQIARALSAAHDKGVVHRDLKPENIFLCRRDTMPDFVKVVDFGIAKVMPVDGTPVRRLTKAGAVFGTPEYMAPEQAAGKRDIDHRVDIYSLGTIFYELLLGIVPHRDKNPVRTIAMQMLDRIIPPSELRPELHLSVELESVMMRALAKRREARFATMGEFAVALEMASGIPITPSAVAGGAVGMASGSHRHRIALNEVSGAHQRPSAPGSMVTHAEPVTDASGAHRLRRESDSPRPSISGTGHDERPRRRNRVSKLDPAFLAGAAGPESVRYDLIDVPSDTMPEEAREAPWWPKAAAGLALFVALGVSVNVLVRALEAAPVELPSEQPQARARPGDKPAPPDEPEVRGPELVATAPADAGTTPADPDGLELIVDADDVRDAQMPPRARPRSVELGKTQPLPPRVRRGVGEEMAPRSQEVTIMTRPEGAALYVQGSYSGPDGTHLSRNWGDQVSVTCKLPGYSDGTVLVHFDGKSDIVLCRLRRAVATRNSKDCVNGLKNPFANCAE